MALDGTLKFDTKIDTEGVENGTRSVKSVMDTFIDAVEKSGRTMSKTFNESSSKAVDLSNKINQTQNEIESLTAKMKEFSGQRIETEEFKKLDASLDKTLAKLDQLEARKQKMKDLGVNENSKSFKSLQYDIDKTSQSYEKLDALRDKMRKDGTSTILGKESAEYQKMQSKLGLLSDRLQRYNAQAVELGTKTDKTSKSLNTFSKNADKASKSASKGSNSVSGFTRMMRMLGQSLMFSMVFRAFSAITKSITEGFQNLSQYSNRTNKDISALKTSLLTLQNSFATAFAPILTVITPTLQVLINTISNAMSTIGQFFAVILTGATTFTKAKNAQVDYAKSLKSTEKQSNKALSSIDKLNMVNTGTGSNKNEGTPLPKDMFEEVKINPKITEFIDSMKEKLKPTIEAFDRLLVAIEPFKANIGKGLQWFYKNVLVPIGNWAITDLIPSFLDLLSASIKVLNDALVAVQPYAIWLFEKFLKPLGIWTGKAIVDGLNLMTDALYRLSGWISSNKENLMTATALIASFFLAFKVIGLVTALAPVISTFASLAVSGHLLSTVLASIGSVIGGLLSPVTIAVAVLGELIFSFFTLYKRSEEFRKQLKELGDTWKSALEPLATFVKTVLTDAWNKILKPVIEYFVKDLLPKIHKTFENLWKNVLVPLGNFLGVVLRPIFKALADVMESLWKNVVLPLAQAFGSTLKEAFNGLYEIINKTVLPIVNKLISVLTWLWKNVINPIVNVLWEVFKPAFDSVFGGIGDVITGFSGILKGLITFITGVFTGNWRKAWEGIKGIFKGIWDSLVGVVKVPVNLIIDIINGLIHGVLSGINAVIRGINAISFEMPDWLGGGKVGFNLQTLSVPKIPKLATGAVIPPNSEFLAILGDQKSGTNIEAPLDTIIDAINKSNIGTSGTIELNVNLDGRTIFKRMIELDKENVKQTGRPTFAT